MEAKLILMLGQMAMQIAQLQADLEKAQAEIARLSAPQGDEK